MEVFRMGENATADYVRAQNANDFNVIQVRLDTNDITDQIERFLSGVERVTTRNPDGSIEDKYIQVGTPKANSLGVQSIMSWIKTTINPQVVQGNFYVNKHGLSIEYDRFIFEFQINICNNIINNIYDYGIQEEEVEGIIDCIMNIVQPFMSRLKGNKERASYAKTMETREQVVHSGKEPSEMFKR